MERWYVIIGRAGMLGPYSKERAWLVAQALDGMVVRDGKVQHR